MAAILESEQVQGVFNLTNAMTAKVVLSPNSQKHLANASPVSGNQVRRRKTRPLR